MGFPVLTAAANVLAHAPGLVRYGSKPLRDLAQDPARLEPLVARLRPYDDAVGYGPNQAYIGNLEPEALREVPRPWFGAPGRGGPRGPGGSRCARRRRMPWRRPYGAERPSRCGTKAVSRARWPGGTRRTRR